MTKKVTKAQAKTEESINALITGVSNRSESSLTGPRIFVGIDPSLTGTGICLSIPIDPLSVKRVDAAIAQRNAIRLLTPRDPRHFYKIVQHFFQNESEIAVTPSKQAAVNSILKSALVFRTGTNLNISMCIKHPDWVVGERRWLVLARAIEIAIGDITGVASALLMNKSFMELAPDFFTKSMLSKRIDSDTTWTNCLLPFETTETLPIVVQVERAVVGGGGTFFGGMFAVIGATRVASLVAQSLSELRYDDMIFETPPIQAKLYAEHNLKLKYSRQNILDETPGFLKKWVTVSALCNAASLQLSDFRDKNITDDMADAYAHCEMARGSYEFLSKIREIATRSPDEAFDFAKASLSSQKGLRDYGVNSLIDSLFF